MDGLTLLREGRRAGLEVRAEGDRLVIRGPKRLEPLAKRLLAGKPEVLTALRQEAALPPGVRLTGTPQEEAVRCLRERGWVLVLARSIGPSVVVVLAMAPASVPAPLRRRFPVFTAEEVLSLHHEGGIEALRRAYDERLLPGKEVAVHG